MKGKRLLCLFIIGCLLLTPFHGVAAEAVPDWLTARNAARWRGTAITEAERDYYAGVTTCAEKTVTDLAKEITKGLATDTARLEAIYDWVKSNIVYDSAHKPFVICSCMQADLVEDALKQKKSNARGMASLATQLCRALDIPSQTVGGYRLTPGEAWGTKHQRMTWQGDGNHWWTTAYADGRWVVFDTVDGRFDLSFDSFTETYLNLDYISDGTFLYGQDFVRGEQPLTLSYTMDKTLTEVAVAEKVGDLTVGSIGGSAFEGCTALKTITLPATITKVGGGAFAGTAIEEAPDLSAIKEAPRALFRGCQNLKTFTFPEHWTVVAASMFQGCTALEEVTLSDNVTQIHEYAFQGCTALTELEWPAGLSYVGGRAFAESGITEAHLPNVRKLGDVVFADCPNLREVTLPAGLTAIPWGTFQNCTALTTLDLPEGLTELEEWALAGSGLTALTLPSTLATIKKEALSGLFALEEIHVAEGNPNYLSEDGVLFSPNPLRLVMYPAARPDTSYIVASRVRRISNQAFAGASKLETLHINASIPIREDWGRETFKGCPNLRQVVFGHSLRTLPTDGFVDCTALTEVTLPTSLVSLHLSDFAGCTALETLTVPASVTAIFGTDGASLPALHHVSVHPDNGAYSSVDGVVLTKNQTELAWYPTGRPATSYEVPEGVTRIGAEAFKGAEHLAAVTLPAGLIGVGESAFQASALTAVTLPESLVSIGPSAFQDSPLTTLTLSEGVTSIGAYAFRGTALATVDLPDSAALVAHTAFWDTPWWNAQPGGPVHADGIFFGMKNYAREKELVIPDGIRLMAVGALKECKDLRQVTVPASLAKIEPLPSQVSIVLGKTGSAAETYARQRGLLFADESRLTAGDTDADGAVTSTDARLALQYASYKVDKYQLFLQKADVDGDGDYTTTDARLMLQYAVGKIEDFPSKPYAESGALGPRAVGKIEDFPVPKT